MVCMFLPLLYQDHLRFFLVSTVLCPGAKGSRSFFLVTTASSYSVIMKNKSFLKQMSRVGEDLLDFGLVGTLNPISVGPIKKLPQIQVTFTLGG